MFLPSTKFRLNDDIYFIKDNRVQRMEVHLVTIRIGLYKYTVLYHGGTEKRPDKNGINENLCFSTEKEAKYTLDRMKKHNI